MKKISVSILFACAATLASAQLNMTLTDQINYPQGTSSLWGYIDPEDSTEYAAVGTRTGVSIVDLTDPNNAVEIAFKPDQNNTNSSWRELKSYGHYIYSVTEAGGGLQVINMTNPANVTSVNWAPNIPGLGVLNRIHSITVDEFGFLYLNGSGLNSGGPLIVDVSADNGSPVYVGKLPAIYCHDSYARNNVLYTSDISQGNFKVYDIADKANPVLLATQQTPFNFTHNTWLNDASDVIFTTDEKANASVAAYDISDLDNIVELDQFRPVATLGLGTIPHNVHVWDDWVVTAYYTNGTIIVDGSRPENLIEVGYFDSFVSNTAGFFGVWGVYPYFPSGLCIASDMQNGLLVYEVNYVRACWLEGKVTNAISGANVSGASVSIASTQANAGTSDLQGNYKTGQAIPGTFNVTFTATGYHPKTVAATLQNGVLTLLDVALEPLVINPFPPFSYTGTTAGCAPISIGFAENSGVAASWQWAFGNGNPATSTEQNPVVAYSTAGTHPVSLQVVTQGGSTYNLASNIVVTVVPAQQAAFTSSTDSLTVSFANTSTFFNSLAWNFGDGGTSTATNPQHSYAQVGSYTATLTVTGGCGTDVFSQTINIGPFTPSAGFGANTVAGCAPLTVTFTDQSTNGPTAWAWTFPGGSPATSTQQHPTVTYAAPGSYPVQITATNAAGSDPAFQGSFITVTESTAANFSTTIAGPEALFSNASTGSGLTYAWDFGDGQTSSEENPLHVYAAVGAYNVILTVNGACGQAVFSEQINIGPFVPVAGFGANMTTGCAPLTVTFADQSTNGPTAWAWSFPGGSPATSTEQHPTVTYAAPGSYPVQLTAANAAGSDPVFQGNFITVGQGPVAGFGTTLDGPEVLFSNASTGSGLTYAWDFGDGQMSDEESPLHVYAAAGAYPVYLTVNNDCGTSSFLENITVAEYLPTADFIADITSGCAPLTVAFTDLSTGQPNLWLWTFEGGSPTTSNLQNPTVTYGMPGSYTPILTVGNNFGIDEYSINNLITVNGVPTVDFGFAINGNEVSFLNSSTNATTYSWVFNDGMGGISSAENPVFIYPNPGTYQVQLTATNNCGAATYSASVTIASVAPTAAFTFNNMGGCAPVQVQFTDQSAGGPTAWAWSFPGGSPATSTLQNPVVSYAAAGVYGATLTATNSAGSSEASQMGIVTVTAAPLANFTAAVTDLTASFTNTSTGTGSLAYAWDLGDGSSSTAVNPAHTYAANGSYTVVLTVTNSCGTMTYEQTVVVQVPAPLADFGVNVQDFCAPVVVEFEDESIGFVTGWAWSFPGGDPTSSTEQHPTVTYATPGDYSMELAVTGIGGTTIVTLADFLTVVDFPVVGFDFVVNDMQASFTNSSQGATSYAWDFGDGTGTSTGPDPEHEYTEPGSYEVTLTASNDCGTAALTQTVIILPSGTGEAGGLPHWFSASPNPFSGQLRLRYALEAPFETASILASNSLGQVVAEVPIRTAAGILELGEGFVGSGVYFLRLVVDGQVGSAIRLVKI